MHATVKALQANVLMAAAATDQITAWLMPPHGVLLQVSEQHLLLIAGTVVVIIVFMLKKQQNSQPAWPVSKHVM